MAAHAEQSPGDSRRRAPEAQHGPLLGRQEECRAVDSLIALVREGLSGTLVLTGQPGIGKTRLLEYAETSAADLRIARIAGFESEARLSFAGLHGVLRPFLDRLDRIPVPQRVALGSAIGLVSGPPADLFLVGLAALTLLANAAADCPLICLVDDAHWLDRESLEVLAFVSRRLHADGIGLVFGVREGSPALTALAGLPTHRISALADREARELLASTVAGHLEDQVSGRIISETGGSPLALIELVKELTDEQLAGGSRLPVQLPVGPRLEAHFLRRVAELPAQTQALLLLVSAASSDEPAVLWRAAALLGLSPTWSDPAVADGLLALQPHVAFHHPLIRTAVYDGAPAADRRWAHEALAAVTDRAVDPDRRAWHLAAATIGPDEEVAAELERSADRAQGRGGYSAEAAFLSRAAEVVQGRIRAQERGFRPLPSGDSVTRASKIR